MCSSNDIVNISLDPSTIRLDKLDVLRRCGLKSYEFILRKNPKLEFLCDPFGEDYNRLVFLDDYKYSIIDVDEFTAELFNSHKMIPKVIDSRITGNICRSNIIPEALTSEWLFNFCVIDGEVIIYDEEIYIPFLKYNIDSLPEFISHYVSKKLGDFSFYAFDDDYVECIKRGKVVHLNYRDIIPRFTPNMN